MSIKPKQIVPISQALLTVRKENNEIWETFKNYCHEQAKSSDEIEELNEEQLLEAFACHLSHPLVEYVHSYKCGRCDKNHPTAMQVILLSMDLMPVDDPASLSKEQLIEGMATSAFPSGAILKNVTMLMPITALDSDDDKMCIVLEEVPELIHARRGDTVVVTLPEQLTAGAVNISIPKSALH